MRITAINIKNFKGIDDLGVHVDLAPITMLFGPNNAGKSTVIQALHLAREVFCHGNPDPDRVEGGGEAINLGGFKEFVHQHDLTRDVTIGLEINLEGEDLPVLIKHELMLWREIQTFYQDTITPENTFLETLWSSAQDALNRIENLEVQVTLSWGMLDKRPFITKYAVYTKEGCIATIHCKEKALPTFSGLDFSRLFTPEQKEVYKGFIQTWLDSGGVDYEGFELMDLLDDLIDHDAIWETILPGSTGQGGKKPYTPRVIKQQIPGCALLFGDSSLDFSEITDSALCTRFLSSLMIGPAIMLREFFQKQFLYIGPLRQIPPRNFMAAKTADSNRWANGLAAWDMLATASDAELNAVNAWLNGSQSLETGYTVLSKKLLPLNSEYGLLNTLLAAVLEDSDEAAVSLLRKIFNQQPEERLTLRNELSGIEISPCDMGVGISQIMPVIVAGALAKRNATIAIEQPELHIHPAWQTVLGDLFLEAINKEDAPLFILETHSEHLILRLLRRIRETYENELPDGFRPVKPKIISVQYVQAKEGGGTEITPLPLTPDGDFERKWPNGFFKERAEELF